MCPNSNEFKSIVQKQDHTLRKFTVAMQLSLLLSCMVYVFPLLAANAVPVTVIQPRQEPLTEHLPLTGTITSKRNAALSPRVSGLVTHVDVDAGSRVKRGDVLIEMDATLAKIDMDRAAAAVSEARVALAEAERLAEEGRRLLKQRNIPESTALSREADVRLKQAALTRLQADYRQRVEVFERHKIIAPFNGVISRKLTEDGEWVDTGTAVLDLVSTDELRLDIQAPQEYYPLLDEYTSVSVYLDAFPGEVFEAHINTKVPVNTASVRTFLVRVLLDNHEQNIIPGMSARAIFTIAHQEDVVTLPRDAIVKKATGQTYVWIAETKDDKTIARQLRVKTGKILANQVVIESGLPIDSTVILKGNETLNDGQTINIIDNSVSDKD
jgi:RND family efflux transporter MFP subunit